MVVEHYPLVRLLFHLELSISYKVWLALLLLPSPLQTVGRQLLFQLRVLPLYLYPIMDSFNKGLLLLTLEILSHAELFIDDYSFLANFISKCGKTQDLELIYLFDVAIPY